MRRRGELVATEVGARAARASAALEGVDLALEDVREIVRVGEWAGRHAADPESAAAHDLVRGSVLVAAEVGRLVPAWREAPLQALARLHVLAASGLAPADALGRPRPDPGIAPRLHALRDVQRAPASVPAVVAAAVVHG